MVAAIVLAAIGGLIIGSFLNVVAYRLPRGESLVAPARRAARAARRPSSPTTTCPCSRGCCCGAAAATAATPIRAQYPLVEALTAALSRPSSPARDDAAGIALGLVLVTLLVPIALIDLEQRMIPNRITAPGRGGRDRRSGCCSTSASSPEQLIAGAAAGGFFLLAALAYPRGMGMGDVKLAGVMGLYLGRAVGVRRCSSGCSPASVVGGVIIARLGVAEGRKQKVPFGPFLALGGVVAIFAGDAVADSYADRF